MFLIKNKTGVICLVRFDEQLMKAVRKSEYTQPTPIQAQAIPAALGGRDIIG